MFAPCKFRENRCSEISTLNPALLELTCSKSTIETPQQDKATYPRRGRYFLERILTHIRCYFKNEGRRKTFLAKNDECGEQNVCVISCFNKRTKKIRIIEYNWKVTSTKND